MKLDEAQEILNEHGFVLYEGFSKDKFIICGIFNCNGTMKKLYYHRMSENWTEDLFEATEFVEYPVQNILKAKTINTPGTKNTLGCKTAKLDHIEVLQVKTMGKGYRKNIKIIDKQVFKENYIMEDYEEQVARKRFAELEGLYEMEGEEAKEFDTNFPVAKIEHGRLMLYRPIDVESLAGENVAKLSIPYKWVDVTEYDDDTWERVLNYNRNFRKTVEDFEYALNLHKAALVKNLDNLNKIVKV